MTGHYIKLYDAAAIIFLLVLNLFLTLPPTVQSQEGDYDSPPTESAPPDYGEDQSQPTADYNADESQPQQPPEDYSNNNSDDSGGGEQESTPPETDQEVPVESTNADFSPEAQQSSGDSAGGDGDAGGNTEQQSVQSSSFQNIPHKEIPEEKPEPVHDVDSGLKAWADFKNRFIPQRFYKDEPTTETTEIKHITTWKSNRDQVQAHNDQFLQGLLPFSVKVNPLSALLPDEISSKLLGSKPPMSVSSVPRVRHNHSKRRRKRAAPPPTLDYRQQPGYVTPPRDQAQALEAQLYGYYGRQTKLSVQQLIDCSRAEGNNGCNGGWPMNAYDYVKKNGIMLESRYPFSEQDTQQCFAKGRVPSVRITGGEYLPVGDEKELMLALWDVGPLAVCLNADGFGFQHYSQGVYKEDSCSKDVNHAVLLVGYGTEAGIPYWLVKNSWGTTWGDGGYIKIYRGSNQCGIASWAQYPLFE